MSTAHINRRQFLANASRIAAAGGLALHLPWLSGLASCARVDGTFTLLTAAEARAMRAFAAQIIPSDDGLPGAEEAGAVHFVDRALAMPHLPDNAPAIRKGLSDLDVRARALGNGATFAELSGTRQVALMSELEHEPFFAAARALVIIGTLADPSYGGNRGGAGWKMIGVAHQPTYSAPFGWYDGPSDAAPSAGSA